MKYSMIILDKGNNERIKINTTDLDKTIKQLQKKRPKLVVLQIQCFQKIRCPECNSIIDVVKEWEEGDPFWTLVCECPKCGYVITESDWDVVEQKRRLK